MDLWLFLEVISMAKIFFRIWEGVTQKSFLTFKKLSLIGRTVTVESQANVLLASIFHRKRNARSKWLLGANNSVSAEEILIVHMHRATFAINIARYTT